MTDIVERLRESAEAWANEVGTRKEAADEIERLRAELAAAQQQAAAYRFIRAGGAYIEPNEGGTVYIATWRGQYCKTPEEFDAVIFAAMENDNG